MGFDLSGLKPCHPRQENVDEPAWEDEESWNAYFKYVNDTPGIYFRNNVWWWRPLWEFVCDTCGDILSKKDIVSGSYNDFHKISKTKSIKLAKRLDKLVADGVAKKYEDDWKKSQDDLRKSSDKDTQFMSNYPFSEDNVIQFSEFVRFSGGFTIG